MTNFLSDAQLASLHAKFVVPVAVSRILNRDEPMDDVAEYMIHDMLGAMKPDTALLCLALCAQHVAAHCHALPIGRLLGLEAERIIEDYAPLWLAQETGDALDDVQSAETLQYTPEDLEAMGDLLLALCNELNAELGALPAILCDILGQEAHMHQEEAEMRLESLIIPVYEPARENVVLFPGVAMAAE